MKKESLADSSRISLYQESRNRRRYVVETALQRGSILPFQIRKHGRRNESLQDESRTSDQGPIM